MSEQTLLHTMRELTDAQLVVQESEDTFSFRHALTREAVYASLLMRERKALHETIAEALQDLDRGSPDQDLADLAFHYYMAGAWDKACEYSRRAGENAQSLYAPRETIEHMTRALEAAGHLSRPIPTSLYRVRGQAYEILGDFEAAHADHEAALAIAHQTGDRRSEWQALLDLGKLWAGSDYARAGDYFQRAHDLAQQTGDPAMIADSLNRLGNWKVNIDQPMQAKEDHQRALAIFRTHNDRRGIADTLDLLGMANYLGGDPIRGTEYYREATSLFEELDDRQGLVSSLTTLGVGGGATYLSHGVPAGDSTLTDGQIACERALEITREIGWRSGEAYALWALGIVLGSQGAYAAALKSCADSVELADEIGHRQWSCAARWALGAAYLDIFAVSQARRMLERSLELARAIGSLHWLRTVSAYLAFTLISTNEFNRAEAVLGEALPPDTPVLTVGQRMAWCARAELALARGNVQHALLLLERFPSTPVALRVARLRGAVFAAAGRTAEADREYTTAAEIAARQGAKPMLWRIHAALGARHHGKAAENHLAAAHTLILELASGIPADFRESFLRFALPQVDRPSAPVPQ